MSFSKNSVFYVTSKSVLLLIFLFIVVYVSLLFCIPGNFLMYARPCEFYFFECWIILNSFKVWALFRNSVKLLGDLSLGLIFPHYWYNTLWVILLLFRWLSLQLEVVSSVQVLILTLPMDDSRRTFYRSLACSVFISLLANSSLLEYTSLSFLFRETTGPFWVSLPALQPGNSPSSSS